MEKEAKKKATLSNNVLLGVLGLLLVVIVGLIVGVAIPKGGEETEETANDGQGSEAPLSSYEIVEQSCEVISQGSDERHSKEFSEAVSNLESVNEDGSVYKNQDFRKCYANLAAYYKLENNTEKADYYTGIVTEMVTDEEMEQMDYEANYFLEHYKADDTEEEAL